MIVQADRPLIYLHCAVLPAWTANSVQVTAMCEALGRIHPRVYLAAFRNPMMRSDLYSHYGVDRTFSVLWLNGNPLPGRRISIAIFQLLRVFGRRWSCYTRIPTLGVVTAGLGIPTVLEVHSVPALTRERVSLRILGRLSSLKRVVLISENLRLTLQESGYFVRCDVLVASDGVRLRGRPSLSKEEARHHFGLPGGAIMAYAGSFKPDKGVTVVLEAVKVRPGVSIALAGGFPEAEYRKLRHAYQGPEYHFLGPVIPAHVSLFLQACDIIVAPFVSAPNLILRSWTMLNRLEISNYMSPLKVFEALAARRPLVISDLPVLQEVLKDGENCLMVPPGDPVALRAAVDRILSEPDLAMRLVSRGDEIVKIHNWDERASRIIGL